MNSKLNHTDNWSELARKANWSVFALAKERGVSVRTLHRHFLKVMGQSTKNWLAKERQRHGARLLFSGSSVKETASSLGYTQPGNFARQYKSLTGLRPSSQSNTL